MRRRDAVSRDVDILKKGSKNSDLERAFDESASAAFGSSQNASESLLDLDMGGGGGGDMKAKVSKVESTLEKLRNIESERKETLHDLRQRTMDDDISNVLILNKKMSNVEQQIFTTELEKYQPHQQRISATIQQQQQCIRELTDAFKALVEDKDAEKLQKRYTQVEQRRQAVISRFNTAYTEYFTVKEDLK